MFQAAGKSYQFPSQLTANQIGEYAGKWLGRSPVPVWQDIHGRRVVHLRERYPCFDSFDYLYEDRYYHWYFIETDGGVTLVYTDDGRPEIEVVENITRETDAKRRMTGKLWDELSLSGLI